MTDVTLSKQTGAFEQTDNQVHLWLLDPAMIGDDAVQEDALRYLNKSELSRCQRFTRDSGRRQFVAGRAALRCLLSGYCPTVRPVDWQIVAGESGRPGLVGVNLPVDAPLFNVSHTGERVALVFSRAGTPGVDMESLRREAVDPGIADRFFSSSEARALQAVSEPDRRESFLNLWTLKEASSKALGGGLGPVLRSHAFDLMVPGSIIFHCETDDPGHWRFWQYRDAGDFLIAVALRATHRTQAIRCHVYGFCWPDRYSVGDVQLLRQSPAWSNA